MENSYANTALLVMDVQEATLKRFNGDTTILKPFVRAVEEARRHAIPVIYVVVGFRKGYPEASANNKAFAAIRQNNAMMLDREEGTRVAAAVAPQEGELVLTKKRHSAFTGSELEVVLRAREVRHLVLAGISTSGVVLSTVREAADKDFRLTVLSDCCIDPDEEVHRVLTTKVFPRQADVISCNDWIRQLTP
jgi:nicotinamidase-related amidase